jgi:hypothetical protein
MNLIPRERGGRLRWIAWAAFWAGFAYLGQMQAWVFDDHSNKPVLADLVDPIHFWFPTVLLMAPCYWLAQPLSALLRLDPQWMGPVGYIAGAVAWVLAFSRMIVWAGDGLHPTHAGWVTAWTIRGIVVVSSECAYSPGSLPSRRASRSWTPDRSSCSPAWSSPPGSTSSSGSSWPPRAGGAAGAE